MSASLVGSEMCIRDRDRGPGGAPPADQWAPCRPPAATTSGRPHKEGPGSRGQGPRPKSRG
eukprot:8942966-Alexandrium_andersonii.AAC.1